MSVTTGANWRVRTGGNNANGGGYDPTISGAATDYTQQDAAQASGAAGTASGTATFTDALASAFTAGMVGNAIQIASGTGFTAGWYFVTAYTSVTTVTLDRSPGTGTAAVWKLGGAFADPFTNIGYSLTAPIAGNHVYINGSGSNFPTSADYTAPNASWTQNIGTSANPLYFIGTNGRPMLEVYGGQQWQVNYPVWQSLVCQANADGLSAGFGIYPLLISGGEDFPWVLINCSFDQNGYRACMLGHANFLMEGVEGYSGHAARSTGSLPCFYLSDHGAGCAMWLCNVHDTCAGGVIAGFQLGQFFVETIFAKCGAITGGTASPGLSTDNGRLSSSRQPDPTEGQSVAVVNCTIDGNNVGIEFGAIANLSSFLSTTVVVNNLITNSGQYGIDIGVLSATQNNLFRDYTDYNFFYGNSADVNGITLNYGNSSHNATGTNPGYAAQSTEGYQIGTALANAGYPASAFPQSLAGMTATQSNLSPGAVQRQYSAPAGGRGARVVAVP